jgi:hypothetical protein
VKRVGIFAAASTLSLAFATGTIGFAQTTPEKQNQGQQQEQNKHQQGHGQRQQSDPGNKSKSNHYGQQKQMQRSQQEERDQQARQARAWQERRANHWEYEHRNWRQRGGYQGYRIPADYFSSHYGLSHSFRVYNLPFMYEGVNPRFQFEGHWFTMMDPYPEYWSGTWHQTDDVYVDYSGDGYYLFNPRYPGRPGIAINIEF